MIRFVFTAAAVILLTSSALAPQNANRDLISKQKKFIHDLYKQQRYFDTIAETRRLIRFLPENKRPLYDYFIGACYFLGKQYKTAITEVKNSEKAGRLSAPGCFLLSRSYMKLGLYKSGLRALESIDYRDNPGTAYELLVRRTELRLHESSFESAIAEIKRYRAIFPDDRTDRMLADMNGHGDIGRKSKLISVALSSVIPGSGQIYSGRYIEGILSFAAVIGAGYAGYYFYRKGERPLSYTFIFFSSLFYCGNIFGAYNSADDATRKAEANFKNAILRKHIPEYSPMKGFDENKIFE
jgi:hypothetical protein